MQVTRAIILISSFLASVKVVVDTMTVYITDRVLIMGTFFITLSYLIEYSGRFPSQMGPERRNMSRGLNLC